MIGDLVRNGGLEEVVEGRGVSEIIMLGVRLVAGVVASSLFSH